MQRQYRKWDQEATVRATLPLSDDVRQQLVAALAAGQSVVVGECVLMKVQADDYFKTSTNPLGWYVCAAFGRGDVAAAANTSSPADLEDAVAWAATTAAEAVE